MSQTGQIYQLLEHSLACLICKRTYFEQEETLLRGIENPTVEHLEREPHADTYICTNCGYILWFLLTKISQEEAQGYALFEHALLCPLCGGTHFITQAIVLSCRNVAFMTFTWIDADAHTYRCAHCGYVQWFLFTEVDRPGQTYEISGRPLTCQSCGHQHFRERQTLMCTKSATLLDTGWTNPAAHTYVCVTCGSVQWFI